MANVAKHRKFDPAEIQSWPRIDQNTLGEGQFFGSGSNETQVTINGVVRENVSRSTTSASMRASPALRSPYMAGAREFGASSMFDVSLGGGHTRDSSLASAGRPSLSEARLRTNFFNGSSTSLAPPTLARATPGLGSRPATAHGQTKPWVNPLDVHFMRNSPLAMPGPKSPLAQYEFSGEKDGDGMSLFGDRTADNVVDAVLLAVERKEKDERDAKDRERELVRKRVAERLEKDRLAREKLTEPAVRAAPPMLKSSPSMPHLADLPANPAPTQANPPLLAPGNRETGGLRPVSPNVAAFSGSTPRPIFRGNVEERPASAGGISRSDSAPAGFSGAFKGGLGGRPSNDAIPSVRRANTGESTNRPSHTQPIFGRSPSRTPEPVHEEFSPGQPPSLGLGPRPHGLGVNGSLPSPRLHGIPPPSGPAPVTRLPSRPSRDNLRPAAPAADVPHASVAAHEYGPAPIVPPRSRARPTMQAPNPLIQNVRAKRETLVVNDSKRLSLSMKIEELERSLVWAQQAEGRQQALALARTLSDSTTTSRFTEDEDENDPISPIAISPVAATAPLRMTPPLGSVSSASASRETSPQRKVSSRLGHGIHRPRPSEYGVKVPRNQPTPPATQQTRPRVGPGMGSDPPRPTLDIDGHEPSSRSVTPQLRQQRYRPENTSPVQSPGFLTAAPSTNADAGTLAIAGFKFDFAPSNGPPTPDSMNSWPLSEASPSLQKPEAFKPALDLDGPAVDGESSGAGKSGNKGIQRSKAPAPLNFDFSPAGYSRAQDGPYTPPLRTAPAKLPTAEGRPQTAGNARGRHSPPSQFRPFEDSNPPAATGLGIGMARGPSVRERPAKEVYARERRPNRQLMSPTGFADQFGTQFV